jgi:hypothetical protein
MSLKESRRIAEECSRIEERLEDDIAEKCSLYAAMDEIMADMMPKELMDYHKGLTLRDAQWQLWRKLG